MSTGTPSTCARSQRTSSACRCLAATGRRTWRQWSSHGSRAPSTAALAPWRSARPACSGCWRCGPTATPRAASSTSQWSGASRWRRRCRSPMRWIPRTRGSCGAAWGSSGTGGGRGSSRRTRTALISRRWYASSRAWRATSTDTSGWMCLLGASAKCPRVWGQPSPAAGSRYVPVQSVPFLNAQRWFLIYSDSSFCSRSPTANTWSLPWCSWQSVPSSSYPSEGHGQRSSRAASWIMIIRPNEIFFFNYKSTKRHACIAPDTFL